MDQHSDYCKIESELFAFRVNKRKRPNRELKRPKTILKHISEKLPPNSMTYRLGRLSNILALVFILSGAIKQFIPPNLPCPNSCIVLLQPGVPVLFLHWQKDQRSFLTFLISGHRLLLRDLVFPWQLSAGWHRPG